MVQAITRMLDVLEALASAREELSLTQLQTQLGLPPPTLHRMLKTLIERGYVEQNANSRHYGPGLMVLEIAEAAKRNARFDLCRIARPFLQQLTDETGETSNLIVPHNKKIVYIEQVSSPRSVRMFTEVGHRAPFYCTGAGKAILSSFSPDQLEDYLTAVKLEQLTPHTFASVEALKHEVSQIRERGFAIDNEEFEIGVRCVAAPIIDSRGSCIGSISVSGPTTRMSYELAEHLGAQVKRVSAQCSSLLGHTSAVNHV